MLPISGGAAKQITGHTEDLLPLPWRPHSKQRTKKKIELTG